MLEQCLAKVFSELFEKGVLSVFDCVMKALGDGCIIKGIGKLIALEGSFILASDGQINQYGLKPGSLGFGDPAECLEFDVFDNNGRGHEAA
jgi:hypothetical protein